MDTFVLLNNLTVGFADHIFKGEIGSSKIFTGFCFTSVLGNLNSSWYDEGTCKDLLCVVTGLTLKSAADFMEDCKHFLDRWRETFNQTLARLILGKV